MWDVVWIAVLPWLVVDVTATDLIGPLAEVAADCASDAAVLVVMTCWSFRVLT